MKQEQKDRHVEILAEEVHKFRSGLNIKVQTIEEVTADILDTSDPDNIVYQVVLTALATLQGECDEQYNELLNYKDILFKHNVNLEATIASLREEVKMLKSQADKDYKGYKFGKEPIMYCTCGLDSDPDSLGFGVAFCRRCNKPINYTRP